jgi:autoinducer 2-degrading protein
MVILQVSVHVKPEFVEAFKTAILENARNSVKEVGVARFDVLQHDEDPTRFVLVEVYRNAEAQARHKEATHYLRWRDTVQEMMAEPRIGVKFKNIFPEDEGW